MGKWDAVWTPPGFQELVDEVKALSTPDLEKVWHAQGRKPFGDYKLRWFWGSSGGGWATIEGSGFRMSVPRETLPYQKERWERVACVVAECSKQERSVSSFMPTSQL